MIKRVLFRKGNKYYWRLGDLHTSHGVVSAQDIINFNRLKSHNGNDFIAMDANLSDNIERFKRGPAVMVPKDIGYIIAVTGINKDSVVVEAGSGCGIMTSYMANIAKKVYSYERRKEFLEIAEKNVHSLNFSNVEFKEKDVYESIDERNYDLLVLDLAEPWRADASGLKPGGFLVAFLPTIVQVMDLAEKAVNLLLIKAVELMEREWIVEKQKVRPKSEMIAHTGFIVFMRRI